MPDSERPHGLQPTRLLGPWDFPGKSTGVGCHCLLPYLFTSLPKSLTSSHLWDANDPNFQSLRFLADSNRRTRFCRPLTKPLIQGTNISFFACYRCFSIAVAKVQPFFESASISKKNFDEIAIFFHLDTFAHSCYNRRNSLRKGCLFGLSA